MAYAGGKGRCYQRIINLMPPHRVYIELFLGSGAVLLNKRPAEISIGIESDEQVFSSWSDWSAPSTRIEHRDAFEFLKSYTFTPDHLLYADPPYLPCTRRKGRVYRHDLNEAGHIHLLTQLTQLSCAVMISGYPSEMYDRMLHDWHKTSFQAGSHVGRRHEVVWQNFEPSPVLHDYSHLGDDFRERERLKRKADRWRRRLQAMPERERRALLSAIGDLLAAAPLRSEVAKS
jgi:site-specific DNA-adenine methylase